MGPKFGDTDAPPWGMKLGDRVAVVEGDERCEPGVGCESGERLGRGPSGWIMGKPCGPSAFGIPPIDRRACWCLFIIARCKVAWLGEAFADTGARVGPRLGLPVFARSSAWTSMPVDKM